MYAGFLEEMGYKVPGAWGRDQLIGKLHVHTDIIISDDRGGPDANNLHSGVLDAIEGFCFKNDRAVIEGSYKKTVRKGLNQITCTITTLNG